MPTIIRAEYLSYYNRARNSDKLFNVFLILDEDGTYSCLTENGRRGSSLVCRTVCEKVRRERAEQSFWEKVREKRNHRETPYSNEPFGSGSSQIASQYASNQQPDQLTVRSETEKVKPKTNVIEFPLEKSEAAAKKPKPGGILNSDQFDSLEF